MVISKEGTSKAAGGYGAVTFKRKELTCGATRWSRRAAFHFERCCVFLLPPTGGDL